MTLSSENEVCQAVRPGVRKIELYMATILSILLCLCVCSCSTLSGGRPLPVSPSDREAINSARDAVKFNVPLITHPLGKGNVRIYEVGFDGTMNDATVDPDDKKTVVGHMRAMARMHYYPGPGTQATFLFNWLDGLSGYSSKSIADQAEQAFFDETQDWFEQDPDTEIRVFVTGFSRGAAIARHFMNAVTRDWSTKASVKSAPPKFYALLFDTVATGQEDVLELSLPPSVEYLVHLVALDEPRSLFIPTLDVEGDQIIGVPSLGGLTRPRRINLLLLPGAHSDIGNAYGRGIGALYRELSEQLQFKLGLSIQNCWDSRVDSFLEGKHDSRGLIDRVLGRPIPNSHDWTWREYLPKAITALSNDEIQAQADRLEKLSLANTSRPGTRTRYVGSPPLVFHVKRQLNHLDVRPEAQTQTTMVGVAFVNDGSNRLLRFHWDVADSKESSILITDPTWESLPQGEEVRLSYSRWRTEEKEWLAVHVDDVWVDRIEINSAAKSDKTQLRSVCKVDSFGNLIDPTQILIFSPLERR